MTRAAATLTAALALFVAAVATAQDPVPKAVPLKPVDVKKSRPLAGYDFAGKPVPDSAFQAKVGNTMLQFFDMDGNGSLDVGTDGIGIVPHRFVVPIPGLLLLASGQFQVAFDQTKSLLLARDALGSAEAYVAGAAFVTELRMRSGLRLAGFDAKASAACEKHCDYLKVNQMENGSGGMSAHGEDPSKPGYTPEGDHAGRKSDLAFAEPTLESALRSWHATAWHRAPLVDPSLTRFTAAHKHGIAMFLPVAHDGDARRPSLDPPDGAIDVPTAFGERGEIPNPVPGSRNGRGCGFPIFVRLPNSGVVLTAATVKDAKGKVVPGTVSSPASPATREWPTNSNLALFIPATPLLPKTRYSVRIELEGADPIVGTFTTAAK